LPLTGIQVTLWGVPADPSHDTLRGSCLSFDGTSTGTCPSTAPDTPLLTLPTSCTGPPTSNLSADAWDSPAQFVQDKSVIPGMTGCDRLPFNPSVSVQPDTTAADSPAGLTVDVHVPGLPMTRLRWRRPISRTRR
jgi:hypothetical protein